VRVDLEVQRSDGTPWLEITLPIGTGSRVFRAQPRDDAVLELHERGELVAVVRRAQPPPGPLTERELEVLSLLARGQTNGEVAQSLNISIRTAEAHRAQIAQKLGRSRRSELVDWALQQGLLGL